MNAYQHELDGKRWADAYNRNLPRHAQAVNRAKKSDYRITGIRSRDHVGVTNGKRGASS